MSAFCSIKLTASCPLAPHLPSSRLARSRYLGGAVEGLAVFEERIHEVVVGVVVVELEEEDEEGRVSVLVLRVGKPQCHLYRLACQL